MRFSNKSLLQTPYVLKKSEFLQKILMTNMGLTSTDADRFLNMRKSTLSLPSHRVIKNCQICRKYNVKVDSLEKFHYCLRLLDYTLEHRINTLKDIGVPVINSSLLTNIIYHFNTRIPLFKGKANIPAEQDIAINIFSGEVPRKIYEISSDKLTVQQYYQMCLLYCKNQMFNLSYLDDKILLHSYMKIKSISMIAETLKVLRLDLQYDDEMIKKNPFVIIASADNIRSLLNSFTDIAGISIVTCLRKYPYILLEDVGNVKKLVMLLKQYEIPDNHVKNCMRIFTVSNEDFQERIKMIKRHPDLNTWYTHPRMLQIICQIRKTKYRMEYVNIMDSMKWAHPQAFLSSKIVVEKSVQTGIVSTKRNLRHVLVQELGVDESELLMRHQHWKSAAFTDIMKMIKYLKKHFTADEIRPNIHIVLYEQSRVEKVLDNLKRQYSQSTEYSFTNTQYLALCLYMLEKDNYFTGDGVWSNEQNTKQQSPEKRDIVEKCDDNTSIVQNVNDNFSTNDYDGDHNDIYNKNLAIYDKNVSNNAHNINS